ncbi:MAG: glycosyl hydrolase [Phycisphaerae bacterium]|jgi:hypothetical protein
MTASVKDLAMMFFSPSSRFKGKPFWAWNGLLEDDELRRQIKIFHQMGFGGFFMHSRVGLATTYLSDEWFGRIRTCIDEAAKNNMEAWLYDEDRWPSGAAGGFVTTDHKYRMRKLVVNVVEPENFTWPVDDTANYIFAAVFHNEKIKWYKKQFSDKSLKSLPANAKIIHFRLQIMPDMLWFNGQAYLDTLNSDAVKKFIEITHEAYKRQVGEHFGKTIPGIFSDEPDAGISFRKWYEKTDEKNSFPWTDNLPQKFIEIYNYDITDFLPEIVFDCVAELFSRPRYHYHQCKTQMFVEAFSKQIGQWCKKNNLSFTGHVLCEDPPSQSLSVSAPAMQFYQYMQSPGIDILTQYDTSYATVKQCASVARQTGRKWVLSELYGCTGWETTFETYKYLGNWQAVLGITFRCHHLAFYSMAGENKRDYPASIHFHSPWHKHFSLLEDYYSRLNVLLTAGSPVCDLLVIHPFESYYLTYNQLWETNPQIKKMDADYKQLVQWLLGNQLDFDFADEQLLIDLQAIVSSDSGGAFLQIRKMKYRTVIVPCLITIRASTLNLLESFAKAGGQVVFLEESPKLLDAEPSGKPSKFAYDKVISFNQKDVIDAVADRVGIVSVRTNENENCPNVFYQLRQLNNGWALFLVNVSREKNYEKLKICLKNPAKNIEQLQLWDAFTGLRYELDSEITKNLVKCNVDIPAVDSALIVAVDKSEKIPLWQNRIKLYHEINLKITDWQFSLDDHNVIVLDRADCATVIDEKEEIIASQQEILRIDDMLRERFHIDKRRDDMVQPWVIAREPIGHQVETVLTYSFTVDVLPCDPVHLAVEQPQRWQIELNNKIIEFKTPTSWWVDPAIKMLPISLNNIKKGTNILKFKGKFDRHANLEIVYLLGGFGVSVNKTSVSMCKLPDKLKLGSWLNQGLPFYSGNIIYSGNFKLQHQNNCRYFIKFPAFFASLLEVKINNNKSIFVISTNCQKEVTEFLCNGDNHIEITLYGSRRNAFGPLHLSEDKPVWIGPQQFLYNAENWQDEYKLIDYGLFMPPVILRN